MENIEQQLQALTRMVQRLQGEVDSLREEHRNGGQYHPNVQVLTLSPDSDYEELFDIASTGEDVKRVVVPLTHRETQILSYIAHGNSNKQTARILGISEQTIKNHISAILRKLNANDRAHAVAIAMCNGWLSVGRKHEGIVALQGG
jgi:DNA-binding CsgD family transcriptional regulator